ncbi:hypothetical protein NDU88_002056 [Pleurodeles waltl]|uniref:Uncharacterized protein n=1 Tax=Pleurodeles waltl TaxID=8319 RepID=A0AAV7SC47_PLEWA|nr:hypothetical protein NDU88_002056 [Pleurodeles waltl]
MSKKQAPHSLRRLCPPGSGIEEQRPVACAISGAVSHLMSKEKDPHSLHCPSTAQYLLTHGDFAATHPLLSHWTREPE